MDFLAEQVSHHPVITATYVKGKKEAWTAYANNQTITKFTAKCMEFSQKYRTFFKFHDLNEKYELSAPNVSAHNLIIGTPYADLGGTAKVREVSNPDYECQVRYHRRGWMSKEEFKCEGEVFCKSSPKFKKGELIYKIHGNWNSKVFVSKFLPGQEVGSKNAQIDPRSTVLVFKKNPYPEKYDF